MNAAAYVVKSNELKLYFIDGGYMQFKPFKKSKK
jgi:hypothetical protein